MTQFSDKPLQQLPAGSYPAMVTPFHADLSIDWQAVDQMTDFNIQGGSAGIFTCGLSAEINFMTDQEKVELAEHVIRHTAGRTAIVACAITTVPLDEQAELIRKMYAIGGDAVAIAVCQLAAKEDDDKTWIRNCETLLAKLPEEIPLAIYECPWTYHRLMSDETLAWTARTGRFCFLKDTCCKIDIIRRRLEIMRGTRLQMFNANTETLFDSLVSGDTGFCGIGANYAPDLYAWLCREYKSQPKLAAELNAYLQECTRLTEGPGYPVIAKEYLRRQGLTLERYSRRRPPELADDLLEAADKMLATDAAWRARTLG